MVITKIKYTHVRNKIIERAINSSQQSLQKISNLSIKIRSTKSITSIMTPIQQLSMISKFVSNPHLRYRSKISGTIAWINPYRHIQTLSKWQIALRFCERLTLSFTTFKYCNIFVYLWKKKQVPKHYRHGALWGSHFYHLIDGKPFSVRDDEWWEWDPTEE